MPNSCVALKTNFLIENHFTKRRHIDSSPFQSTRCHFRINAQSNEYPTVIVQYRQRTSCCTNSHYLKQNNIIYVRTKCDHDLASDLHAFHET